jgi:hypothetical protein
MKEKKKRRRRKLGREEGKNKEE